MARWHSWQSVSTLIWRQLVQIQSILFVQPQMIFWGKNSHQRHHHELVNILVFLFRSPMPYLKSYQAYELLWRDKAVNISYFTLLTIRLAQFVHSSMEENKNLTFHGKCINCTIILSIVMLMCHQALYFIPQTISAQTGVYSL